MPVGDPEWRANVIRWVAPHQAILRRMKSWIRRGEGVAVWSVAKWWEYGPASNPVYIPLAFNPALVDAQIPKPLQNGSKVLEFTARNAEEWDRIVGVRIQRAEIEANAHGGHTDLSAVRARGRATAALWRSLLIGEQKGRR